MTVQPAAEAAAVIYRKRYMQSCTAVCSQRQSSARRLALYCMKGGAGNEDLAGMPISGAQFASL